MDSCYISPVRLIEEVKKKPVLYEANTDRTERMQAWKEVGAAMFKDWDTLDKGTSYDRVLQIQKKWRSLRDAYARELRARRTGVRVNLRVYMYFKKMSFLGGFEGPVSTDEDGDGDPDLSEDYAEDTFEIKQVKAPKAKRIKLKKSRSISPTTQEEVEMPIFPVEMASVENDSDNDRLFLLSFLPELRQLPRHINMWARAQIANIMQEAVTSHYHDTVPGSSDSHKTTPRHQSDL